MGKIIRYKYILFVEKGFLFIDCGKRGLASVSGTVVLGIYKCAISTQLGRTYYGIERMYYGRI